MHHTSLKAVCGLILCLTFTQSANATLMLRSIGSGTDNAVYDDVLDITWLADANLAASNTFGVSGINVSGTMTWSTAQNWIAAMNSANYLGYNDWRLPTMVDTGTSGCNISTSGGTDCGWNVQTTSMDGPPATAVYSEMASLYYDTLGNLGYYDTSGNSNQPGWGLQNSGPFQNLQSGLLYWSGLEFAPRPSDAWGFNFNGGLQGYAFKDINYFALAVRPGDVSAVPVPAAVWLLGSALVGLLGFRKSKPR